MSDKDQENDKKQSSKKSAKPSERQKKNAKSAKSAAEAQFKRSGVDRRQDFERAKNYPAEKDRRTGPRRYDDRRIEEISRNFTAAMSENQAYIKQAERKAVFKSVLTIFLLLVIVAGVSVLLVGPKFFEDLGKEKAQRVQQIEAQYEQMREKQRQLIAAQKRLRAQVEQFMGGDLYTKIAEIENLSAQVRTMNDRIAVLKDSTTGQQILSDGTKDLQSMILGMQGRVDNLETTLETAKQDNDALADMLEGMSGNELKAAAMMLAVTQLRESLMGEGTAEQDLATVRMLAGDDPELLAAIDKLAPYARNGIMSRTTLTREFKGLAGEIVQAELRGEDVSWKDKAMNRLDNLVSVRKKGMAEGQDTDAIVARAETLLQQGDFKQAIAELEKLDGAPAQKAQPWIDQAEARMAAEELSKTLSSTFIQELRNMGAGRGGPVKFGPSGGGGPAYGGGQQKPF